MKSLPGEVAPYRRTSEFTEATLPAGLRRSHTTMQGTWALIHVVEGRVRYRILEPELEEHLLSPEAHGVVEPEVPHELELDGPVRLYVEFYR